MSNLKLKRIEFLAGEDFVKEFDALAEKNNWNDRSDILRTLMREQIVEWKKSEEAQ